MTLEVDRNSHFLLADLSWPEVSSLLQHDPLVVIPTGSVEQHGWHLPLETDSLLAHTITYASVAKLARDIPILMTPTLAIGFSREHMDFPGTLSLSAETYTKAMMEIVLCLVQHGFRRLVILNGHAGNTEPLKLVVRRVRENHDVLIALANYWALARDALIAAAENPKLRVSHGGEIETALMLYLHPERVRLDYIRPSELMPENPYLAGSLLQEPQVWYGFQRTDLTSTGHTGDPTQATAELGQRFFAAIVDATVAFLRFVHTSPLPIRRPLQMPDQGAKEASSS